MAGSEHAVFVLPTQEDIVALDAGKKPGNVLWRGFGTADELGAFSYGIDIVADENDVIDRLSREGVVVTVVRGEEADRFTFATDGEAEAFRQGVEDAEGFKAPLLIGRDDGRFARLAEISPVRPYTFEQFRATKFECPDVFAALEIDGMDVDEDGPVAGNVYLGAVWIERQPGGRWHLLIENSTEIGDDLEKFERELYQWAVDSGIDLPTPDRCAVLESEMAGRVRAAAEARDVLTPTP